MPKRTTFTLAVLLAFTAGILAGGVFTRWYSVKNRKTETDLSLQNEGQFIEAVVTAGQHGDRLYAYRGSELPIDNSVYLSDHPLDARSISLTFHKGKDLQPAWKGVAWVKKWSPTWDDEIAHCSIFRKVDGIILYGDPDFVTDLVRRIGH